MTKDKPTPRKPSELSVPAMLSAFQATNLRRLPPLATSFAMEALEAPKPRSRKRSSGGNDERTIQHDFYVYVDTVVMTVNPHVSADEAHKRLEVLLMHRPGAGDRWALPGGAIRDGEALEQTARRKVFEEAGIDLTGAQLHQVGAFGDPKRDDRWRAISIAYMALLPHPGTPEPHEHSDGAEWRPFHGLRRQQLEFDHFDIIEAARRTAERLLEDTPVALGFCKPVFTLSDLRSVYEAFQQRRVDAANFRRKVEATKGFVQPVGVQSDTSLSRGRPPMLYRAGRATELNPPIRFSATKPDESPRSGRSSRSGRT
ncbi:MAG: NUDIX hydrolase [Ilumatobacteraceae bacterium]